MVGDKASPHTEALYAGKPSSVFDKHLEFLKANFEMLSYSALRDAWTGGKPKGRPGMALTFDDGLRECYEVVRPLLKKHGVPCIFFIPTGFIANRRLHYNHKASLCSGQLRAFDKKRLDAAVRDFTTAFGLPFGGPRARAGLLRFVMRLGDSDEERVDRCCALLDVDSERFLLERKPYLDENELRTLVKDGFTIGAHSITHRHLGTLPLAEQREEILGSIRTIQALTGQSEVPFAFPFSADGVDRGLLRQLRRECEAVGLFFDLHGIRQDDEVLVNRIWAESPLISPSRSTPMHRLLRNSYQAHWFGLE
jgi:peptidoglycan/xylan/chitin deacetylase (PgdA/CDA1 family)